MKADLLLEYSQFITYLLIIKIMKKTTLIGALMTFVLAFTFTFVSSTYADTASEDGASHPSIEERQEMRAAIQEAVANADYDTWVSLVGETRFGEQMLEIITEDNFDTFAEAHNLINEGRELIQSLEIPRPVRGSEKPTDEMKENREAIKAAVESGDYETWASLASDEMLEVISTEDDFNTLVEAHNMIQEGREIMEDLGVPKPPKRGQHQNR